MPADSRFDAVVIGAGHNGLTTAAYLARAGRSVLVLERREIVGGCAVTEEIDPERAPGCRVSSASYIASMLRPEVIRDLRLPSYGLRMIPCEPGVQTALPVGDVISWWSDAARMREELAAKAPEDVETFFAVDAELRGLAKWLQPFFMEAPPDPGKRGLPRLVELLRVGRRFRGISGDEIAALMRFLSGSLGEFLDRHFESDGVKRLILSNSLYGKHGGPYQPGTAMGLLFHLLSGGEEQRQGYAGHVVGGMGAITQAMAASCRESGVTIRTGCEVAAINQVNGRATGVTLVDGSVVDAGTIVSNADPKRTFLQLAPEGLSADFLANVAAIRMAGPCAKVNLVLSEEPRVRGMPASHSKAERSLFTLAPSLEEAEASYNEARQGVLPKHLWVDCVVASNVDPGLVTEGRHVLTCFVQYVPYRLDADDWNTRRESLGDQVVEIIGRYAENVPGSVVARKVYTPLDLEQVFGITEGNIFHGDICLEQLFFMRPLPGWSQYRTPIAGLYLCGAGTHPGGGVTGAPGYNAARRILADRR
jgi:phytoene dehydrogenase-like protein